MPTLVPVDNDPFAASSASAAPTLVPVDHDPFAADAGGGGAGEPDKTQFPYDEPGATYGSVVPIERDRTGDLHLAWPELIRSPVRGMVEGGARLMGRRPEQIGKGATPDELAAVMTFAPGLQNVGAVTKAEAPGTLNRIIGDTRTGTKAPMSAPNTGAPTLTPAQTKAVARVTKRMGQDAAAGGVRPEQAYDALIQGKATGKPVILADVGGRNVGKLAGSVARAPGEASEFAEQSTKARLSGAGERLSGDVDKYIASGPTMRQSVEQLRADQRTAAAPLYAEALKPGSVAPLEKQFEEAFDEVSRAEKEANTALTQAQQQVTLAAAEKARAGDNVYAANRALRNERNAQTELEHAIAETQEAAAAKQAVLTRLREAQTAAAAGERGGIWSPYIQRLLGNHNVQNGIKRGLEIQKNEADALNQPFNPNDYAVDAEGSVIRTPNMRLLDAAKKGLDAILEDYRDPTSGRLALDERGRSIEMLRKSLVAELDRVNGSYAAARAAWAGPAAQLGATKAGTKAIDWHPEDIQKYWDRLSDSEKPFFKMGIAQALKDAIAKKSVTAPEIRAIGRNSYDSMMKQRLRPMFDGDKQFNDFLDAVTTERTMLEKATGRTGNSQTAERASDDANEVASPALHGAAAVGHAASGNFLSATRAALALRRELGLRMDPEMNAEIAKLLFDPQLDLTRGPGAALMRSLAAPGAIPPHLRGVVPPP